MVIITVSSSSGFQDLHKLILCSDYRLEDRQAAMLKSLVCALQFRTGSCGSTVVSLEQIPRLASGCKKENGAAATNSLQTAGCFGEMVAVILI